MSDKKPINDAMEHMSNIEGYPTNVDIKGLPKPLRYFGYFMIGFFSLSILFIIIAKFLT
ncbi:MULTISPECIES: amino acid transporter [unclassified Bacillus (in: firmicutes)]|uniref:amino acid transporter n=1 Tax=unclassified Bacillus (in: firmicutes) TaxID=185979 RepID=UPI001BE950E8|nr:MULTISPECIES: amino acid transporter [unclassified Bacillus (in: firmicutes)]MBT2640435.1 amino acid transporter [Bacillus sp. ISL-39]MBT2663359.1 amino acid transporter [Bacillus sp. ISL-45]